MRSGSIFVKSLVIVEIRMHQSYPYGFHPCLTTSVKETLGVRCFAIGLESQDRYITYRCTEDWIQEAGVLDKRVLPKKWFIVWSWSALGCDSSEVERVFLFIYRLASSFASRWLSTQQIKFWDVSYKVCCTAVAGQNADQCSKSMLYEVNGCWCFHCIIVKLALANK